MEVTDDRIDQNSGKIHQFRGESEQKLDQGFLLFIRPLFFTSLF